ncbi:hypothetical protein R84B8_01136 [Treponema sp. R8-4-B8]
MNQATRQQATGNRQQATGNRQQATGNRQLYQLCKNRVNTPLEYNQSNKLLFSFRVQADSVVFLRNTACLLYNFAVGKVSAHIGG